jgi:ribose 1,5-bisphosphate isomerase
MLPKDAFKIAEDIRDMRIRGAGQIARSAVEALEITARESKARDVKEFL